LTSESYESIFGHLVGFLERGIGLSKDHYRQRTAQHRKTRTQIHAFNWIRPHDPSVRAVEDRKCLKPRSHWDWHLSMQT